MPVDYRKVKLQSGTMHFGAIHPTGNCKVRWEFTPMVWSEGKRRAVPGATRQINSMEAAKYLVHWRKSSDSFRREYPEPSQSLLAWMKRNACRLGSEEISVRSGYLTAWRARGR